MCGRFAFFHSGRFGYASLSMPEAPAFERFNIGPAQDVLAIRLAPETGEPEFVLLHWGLVPFWSKIARTRSPLINARAEAIEAMPSFRGPFRHRRCIIPASGFYAWRRQDRAKQPYFIRARDGGCLAMAGIWDSWHSQEGGAFDSCAIITTQANGVIGPIHDRMPVFLAPEDLALWLDQQTKHALLLSLLRPCPEALIELYPVSDRMNNPHNNGPECVARIEAPEPEPFLPEPSADVVFSSEQEPLPKYQLSH